MKNRADTFRMGFLVVEKNTFVGNPWRGVRRVFGGWSKKVFFVTIGWELWWLEKNRWTSLPVAENSESIWRLGG